MDREEIIISPVDSADIGQQKCRVSIDTLSRLGAPIGSFVRICLKEASIVCSLWPNNLCPEGNVMKVDNSVFSRKQSQNHTSAHLQVSGDEDVTLCSLQPMTVSETVCANVTIVVKCIDKYLKWRKQPSVQKSLKQKCLHCLRRKCVTENCTVTLKTSKLGNAYGVVFIHIDKLTTKSESEGGIMNDLTKLVINNIQSEERYLLSYQSQRTEIGGVSKIARDLHDLLDLPLKHSGDFKHLGLPRPKGILLRGPPGCGKTSLVRNLSQSSQAALVIINGPEILSPHPGESEENVRKIFQKALRLSQEGPCILFIDEIDSVCPRRGKSGGSNDEKVTSALMSAMDDLSETESLVVIGATNRPSALDPALRRPGRFDREVLMNVPNRDQRHEILAIHTQRLPLVEDVDLDLLADLTNGYVGADLASLCNEAAYGAMERSMSLSQDKAPKPSVNMCDFMSAVHTIIPSIQKGSEGVVDLRPVQWEDIGGLEVVKIQIRQAVEWPMLYPEAFNKMGIPPPRGVLLYGPPGCCKTTLVRAAATATRAAFVSLSGAQLYSPFVGDSERLVTEVFQKSRAMSPTILFLDEIDSIVGKRSEGKSHRGVQERVLSALLNEMDGIGIRLDSKTHTVGHVRELEEAEGSKEAQHGKQLVDNNKVLVVAATNRPDLVDEAILRPGRIDRIIYVSPPDEQTRLEILKVYTRKMPVLNVDIDIIAEKTPFYTGADLENLCKEAALCSLTESLEAESVTMRHFIKALDIVKPSLNPELVERYKNLGDRYKTS